MDPALTSLLDNAPLAPLGPGQSLSSKSEAIAQAIEKIPDHEARMKKACEAGLWLMHNFLERCHTLSQNIDSPSGAFWHGIMHRREPDASNAAYWFKRVGQHPIFPSLAEAVSNVILSESLPREKTKFTALTKQWDPMIFIDLCEKFRDSGQPEEFLCRKIQLAENRLLLTFCYDKAAGRA